MPIDRLLHFVQNPDAEPFEALARDTFAFQFERIPALRAATDKPLLLEEVGYSTQRMADDDQARTLAEIIAVSEREGLLGCLIWTAFDFPTERSCYPSPCPSPDNAEHYFGVWRADYTAKPAVEVISQAP